jgi:hypothetical protein
VVVLAVGLAVVCNLRKFWLKAAQLQLPIFLGRNRTYQTAAELAIANAGYTYSPRLQ